MMPRSMAERTQARQRQMRRQRFGARRRAAVFAKGGTVWGEHFGPGLNEAGYDLTWIHRNGWEWSPEPDSIDLAVFTTMRGNQGRIRERYQAAGVPCIASDMPHIRLPETKECRRVFPCDHAWTPADAPSDRIDALPVVIHEPRAVEGGHVVILGQSPGDSAHGMERDALDAWVARVVATCREQLPGRKLVFRPHPGAVWPVLDVDHCVEDPHREGLAETLEGASLVCTFNSTAGLESMLLGYPVAAWGRACYSELASSPKGLAGAVVPTVGELRSLLARIAYTQWSWAEIRSGQPFFFLAPEMERAA